MFNQNQTVTYPATFLGDKKFKGEIDGSNIDSCSVFVASPLPTQSGNAVGFTADGKIIRPERVGDKWILNGNPVMLSYPKCSNYEQLKSGAYLGSMVLILFVVIYGFRLLINFLKDIGKVGS